MRGVAKTKLTPDMLTLAGVTLCLAGAVLVGFEERNDYLFFWLGERSSSSARSPTSSTAPSRAPRARGRSSRPSSTRPSTGWARRRCSPRSVSRSCETGTRSRWWPRSPPSSAPSSSRTRARRRRRSASRRRRLRLARRAGRAHLGRSRPQRRRACFSGRSTCWRRWPG